MAGINTFSTFSANAQTFIAAQTLLRIKRDTIVFNMGKKEKLPNRFSKTFQFTRYEKLDLPRIPLTEGVTPAQGRSMQISTVQAVMDQWGDYVILSDVAEITAKHPALQQAIQLIAEQATETLDREAIELLLTNTSVNFPGVVTSRLTLTATDYVTTTVVKEALAALRNNGAHPVSGGRIFMGLMDPSVELDLLEDSTFIDAATFSNIRALQNGEAGQWMGVRWMVSNLLPTIDRLADVVTAGAIIAGGALAAATTYYIKVVAIDNALGFEVAATQEQTQVTGGGDNAVQVTMPATAGRTYDLYFGAAVGVTPLHSQDNAPAAVVDVLAVPAGSEVPIAHPAVGVTVHPMWVMGMEAFAVPELQSLQTFLTPATPSDSDPLRQRRKVGWKVMFKPVIQNELFIERIEVASRF
jgi:N4-gp56 family major capsid protein